MTVLRTVLLVLHLVGMAAIIGPALEQLSARVKRMTGVMVWGARAQILTGLALVGVAYASDYEPDHVKLAVKLVVALAIAGFAEATRRRENPVTAFWAVTVLTAANVIVAVAWR